MNREQLAHVVRAAATVVGVDDVIVLGSQAILATVDDMELPYEVTRSIEADIAVDHQISSVSVGCRSGRGMARTTRPVGQRVHRRCEGRLVPEPGRCLDIEGSCRSREGC